MKKILMLFLMLFLLLSIVSCAKIDGTHFVSMTTIGIEAGLPEGVTLVIGYRRAEIVRCETEASINIGLEGTVTATSLEGKQHSKFGRAADGDITINERRSPAGEENEVK